jgi:hypothetical protein
MANNGERRNYPTALGQISLNILSARRVLTLALLAASIQAAAHASGQADPWQVLNKITHRRSYRIQTRDRGCVLGKIKEVTGDHLTAEVYGSYGSGSPVSFRRSDILRVSVVGPIYYSGRSSWADVRAIHLKGRGRLKIVTTAGKTYVVKPPVTISDDAITFQISGKSTKVAKGDVAEIYHIVAKPLTDGGEYLDEELGPLIVFDPDLWAYGLHLEQYVAVLLYNAAEPEDDSPSNCEKVPAPPAKQ